ncbi:hypothetical protein ACNF49_30810 [Actinomadura sp. ATCC 39365]|uniref:hypothetical protein n=1 Tax=Nonomuraea sp. NPDC005692 TaxID=3157168 RepID=UPI0033F220FE
MLDPAHLHLFALLAAPAVVGVLARLLRRPRGGMTDIARVLLDLVSLRMVLRDAGPDQRATLLNAHRAWRATAAVHPEATMRPARQRTSRRR